MFQDLKPKRKFGRFNCTCGNSWASGNAWAGKWQKCLKCDEQVTAADLRPLKPSGRHSNEPKPHISELCQKCIELGPGRNCKDYVPPSTDESIDIPDDQSIISEASTASSSLINDQQLSDEDSTPVGSDDDDYLESKLKSLKI